MKEKNKKDNFVYKNGNAYIDINPRTGVKKRFMETNEDVYFPEFPENIDLNLSYYCEKGCSYCYLNASKNGRNLSEDIKSEDFIDYLNKIFKGAQSGLEIAMNINHGDDLRPVLFISEYLHRRNFIPNFTIDNKTFNSLEFEDLAEIAARCYAFGISIDNFHDYTRCKITEIALKGELKKDNTPEPQTVYHIINGLFNEEDLLKIKNEKILILGYKENVGRAGNSHKDFSISTIKELMKNNSVSFDNLGVKQLKILEEFPNESNYLFLGKDGDHSFYIDLVNKTFSISSTEKDKSMKINNRNIKEMFNEIRKIPKNI